MVGVLTYNIHSGVGGDGVYDLERIAGVVRRSGADIACLQEVQGLQTAEHAICRSPFRASAGGGEHTGVACAEMVCPVP